MKHKTQSLGVGVLLVRCPVILKIAKLTPQILVTP